MKEFEPVLPRRSVIKGAGLGLVAGALGETLPVAAAAADSEIWSGEYWAKKGDVPLWMYRKRLGAPKQGEGARPIVFFVHGSSVTSRVFDLTVPGRGDYSVMNEFARQGFDCWTMDHENYGKSGRTSGNSDIASGVEDLKAAAEVLTRETGQSKCEPPHTVQAVVRMEPKAPLRASSTRYGAMRGDLAASHDPRMSLRSSGLRA